MRDTSFDRGLFHDQFGVTSAGLLFVLLAMAIGCSLSPNQLGADDVLTVMTGMILMAGSTFELLFALDVRSQQRVDAAAAGGHCRLIDACGGDDGPARHFDSRPGYFSCQPFYRQWPRVRPAALCIRTGHRKGPIGRGHGGAADCAELGGPAG
jgi:hypothetical protein